MLHPRTLICALLCLATAAQAQAPDIASSPVMEVPGIELPDLAGSTFILGTLSATELKRRLASMLGCTWSRAEYFPTTCTSYLVELSLDKDNAPLLRMTYENPPADSKNTRQQVLSVANLLGGNSPRISPWLAAALDESERGTPQSSRGILDGTNPVWALVCSYHPRGDAVPPNGYTDVFFTSNPTYIVGGCGQ